MKILKKIIITLVLSNICISCITNNTKQIPINFVFDTPIEAGKYPSYLKEIAMPFKTNNCEEDILLKPINITRLDIKRAPFETNAWYFEKMGDNTVEFSTQWLKHYFKDSIMPVYASTKDKIKQVSPNTIDKYINNNDILTLIYSEDSDLDSYNNLKIYTSPKDVSEAIKAQICPKNYKSIAVIVNPKKLKNEVQSESVIKGNPCDIKSISEANVIKNKIVEIIDINKSLEERMLLSSNLWDNYFTKNSYVALYQNTNDNNPNIWNPGKGKNYFVNRLAILESIVDVSIFKIEYSKRDKKISGIHIVECQNLSEAY